ncbi:GMC oxidoreductase [Dothidotthia symphoricarpi CBS 119687]|uniref:GMC oxidoreductase n=1 Tax=Dothidotthia symphoricarpi CBS 119687 TaxID=1392245 RepID=A0A6A6AG37_9PLEO|nr:GMC oxidoreductase [Dothidotthia symphoricarpi CBS 119687]KAF2129381.1 GMC oxidoreductase [Dothidotthia symphoricarpi CBS 119687]
MAVDKTYDFIIVGAGTAGCLLAHRLSHSPAKPSVLVLEAGAQPEGEYLRAPFHRFLAAALRPDLDHGYVSEPEPTLNGREITYTRGKGLGGSSILNFGVYLTGSSEDYNRWADLVGDETWRWESVQKSFHAIENYGFGDAKAYSGLAQPGKEHGTKGQLKVGLPAALEEGVVPQMQALREAGEKINLDPNSGNPVGVSVFPNSYSKVGRSTSAGAHLLDPPDNLEIWTDATVQKLVFQGDRVVGVETKDGRKATSSKEVILCGGAIDSPKLLLQNGIGPKQELEALGIDVKKDLPGVGKHLQDHVLSFMSVETEGAFNGRYAFESNQKLLDEAAAAWEKDQSGAFSLQQSVMWGGFLKILGLEEMPEYKALPKDHQEYLSRDAVPTYEFINNGLLWPPGTQLEEGNSYMTCIAFLMNPQSEGSVTLRSSNPDDKPIIHLNYLTHPYDKRIMREAIRATWTKLVLNPTFAPSIRRTICGPKSMSDEHVDEFMTENAGTVWHANGTVVMGKPGDAKTCVDSSFRVLGVKNLRVADLSVSPLTTNNHTQPTAYLMGQKCAERLIEEYGLGEKSRRHVGVGTPKV